jgi:hypothetical protein
MITPSLISFVNDFKLAGHKGTIVFDGNINFSTARQVIELTSQIHIIHLNVKRLDIIYLLNPELPKRHIPDMVDSNAEIGYWPRKTLFTNGNSPVHGAYTLLIVPCQQPGTIKC